ncbi:MAG: hypothetical protein A2W98_08545 [Bacteroidetes bacterium GWF2_33_38]|nr:MAG: hypothetical protein A2W98_08545 [Bacteroidetes bacterium GWF2_33_38]OFY72810.1 MAG: hypothetical protein A2265_08615 [Bacteroidetes bacterium RIFOXYA12_FULL_33_9]
MGKYRYTKAELEVLVYKQLENLNALGEQIKLLEEQNLLLTKLNHKLMSLVSDKHKEPIPYPKPSQKKKQEISAEYLQASE